MLAQYIKYYFYYYLFEYFSESASQVYYDVSPTQKSHNQQNVILVNDIKDKNGVNDLKENMAHKDKKKEIVGDSNDMSSCNIVKNAPEDEKSYKTTEKKSETDDVLKEDCKTDVNMTGENLFHYTPTYAQNELHVSSNSFTGSIQNQNSLNTTMTLAGSAPVSKIPILHSNLRQAKCASWAGGELATQQIHSYLTRNSSQEKQSFNNNSADIVHLNEAMSLTPSKSTNKPNVADNPDCVVFQNPDITDLTPGLLTYI